jgi:hypothetical protein
MNKTLFQGANCGLGLRGSALKSFLFIPADDGHQANLSWHDANSNRPDTAWPVAGKIPFGPGWGGLQDNNFLKSPA